MLAWDSQDGFSTGKIMARSISAKSRWNSACAGDELSRKPKAGPREPKRRAKGAQRHPQRANIEDKGSPGNSKNHKKSKLYLQSVLEGDKRGTPFQICPVFASFGFHVESQNHFVFFVSHLFALS